MKILRNRIRSLGTAGWRFLKRFIFVTQHPRRRLIRAIFIGLVVSFITSGILYGNLLQNFRYRAQDSLYSAAPTSDIITIVAIDDQSLQALGRSPTTWDRAVHARLIDQLSEAGARVITFDIIFDIPSEDDALFAEAITNARRKGTHIVLAAQGYGPNESDGNYSGLYAPVETLSQRVGAIGAVNAILDEDGVIRRLPLVANNNGEPIYGLSLASYIEYLLLFPEVIDYSDNILNFPVVPGRNEKPIWKLKTDDNGRVLVSFFGEPSKVNNPQSTFLTYSYIDVLNGAVSTEAFEGKIVLIGAFDDILPDRFPTPISSNNPMFGVEIHANLIETIHQASLSPNAPLTRQQLYEQSEQDKLAVTLLVVIASALLMVYLRWSLAIVAMISEMVLIVIYAIYSFDIRGEIVEVLTPLSGVFLVFVGVTIANYLFEERRRNQINDLFSRYVSPEIARKVVESFDQGHLELGGEERELTVLFADIRGFTSLTEGLSASEVVTILNYFLERMNTVVLNNNGAINKYIGDNLMAFWNAPYPQEDHAWMAVKTALEMLTVIEEINKSDRFKSDIQFGIGVNTGTVVVGNIGSEQRLEYTPIGDTVNVASRLSGAARGGICMIGPQTFEAVQSHITPIKQEETILKGKSAPMTVYLLDKGSWRKTDT